MHALTYHGLRDVRYEPAPDPRIVEPGDAIVDVELAGLCGSDLHVWHGRERGLDAGTILGHEFVGRVREVGPEVRTWRAGDRVAAPFSTCCGACFYCRRGLTARCPSGRLFGWVQDGRGLAGAQAESVRVPFADATLFRAPDDVDEITTLLLCDVLPTGWFGARRADLEPGDVAVVIGCGPVGLAAIVALRHLGIEAVYAVDRVHERLAWAARFGATPIDAGGAPPVEAVREATGGRGADAVVEAVGSPEAGGLAFALVRPGGTISAIGVHHERDFPFSPGEAYDRNLTFRIGRCPARGLANEATALARAHPEIAEIVTHRVPLRDGAAAYESFDRKEAGCVKFVFIP